MQAVLLKAYGDENQLFWEETETPTPGEGEVLVKTAATSVNPIDWKIRSGARRADFPLALPAILGRDLAGEIAELGAGVSGLAIGQRVMALTNRTYAEYVVVRAADLAPIPEALSFQQAAAMPLVVTTGAQLAERGVKAHGGQSLIITGALGSVGRTAVYVATRHGAQVIAAVREAQMKQAETLGSLALVALEDEHGLSIFKNIDALADTVGGAVAVKLLPRLRTGATFATVVQIPPEVKDYDIISQRVTSQPDALRLAELANDLAENRFKIPVARVMKLSEIREAHRLGQAGGVSGKIVLVV